MIQLIPLREWVLEPRCFPLPFTKTKARARAENRKSNTLFKLPNFHPAKLTSDDKNIVWWCFHLPVTHASETLPERKSRGQQC